MLFSVGKFADRYKAPPKGIFAALAAMTELWVAREKLAEHGGDRRSLDFNDANASLKTWSGYCKDIGINYTTANRWLNKLFP